MTTNVKIVGKPDLKIEELYAIIAKDENGDEGIMDEGIMGASMVIEGQPMMMPLVGADETRVRKWIPHAVAIAKETGMEFRICRFRDRKDVTDEFL
jgi:hypothetical protein